MRIIGFICPVCGSSFTHTLRGGELLEPHFEPCRGGIHVLVCDELFKCKECEYTVECLIWPSSRASIIF